MITNSFNNNQLKCIKFTKEKAININIIEMFPECNKDLVNEWEKKLSSYQNETILFLMFINNKPIGFVIMREAPCDPYHPEEYIDNDSELFKLMPCPIDNYKIPFFSDCYLINYRYILPKFRNKGFGTRILKHIMKKKI